MTLIRSVSGVRGTTGVDITESLVRRYAAAFGAMVGGDVAVGWDGRRGGDSLLAAVVRGLGSAGARALDAGLVPTPTVGIAVRKRGLAGGVVVTASHNPEAQNGLKFFSKRGIFLVPEDAARLFAAADSSEPPEEEGPEPSALEGALRHHLNLVLSSRLVDREGIASRAPKVVVDCVNAAGSHALPTLLRELGCRVTAMNAEPGRGFTRGPEPVPENLGGLAEAVSDAGADVGLACDPDADRLAVVDEHGSPVGEEYTLALAARAVLARTPGPIVANVSTSRMMDDVASEFSVPIHRSPVGEVNVVTKMEEVSAVVGGEGNGGVILPDVHLGRDACTAAALVMTALCDAGCSASELLGRSPSYSMLKTKLGLPGVSREAIVGAVRGAFPDALVDLTDGPKMTWPDRWVHARMSGTEPVVRVIAEAPDRATSESLVERATDALLRTTEGGS
ncbi:MAG: phosphoglucosamine mutase [Candidatus Eisenbacteria bacterium]